MQNKGKLYLIPSPLGTNAVHTLPTYTIEILHQLRFFIAERAKTARHFIKDTQPVLPFSELTFYELNKRTPPEDLPTFLNPILEGKHVGLLSEAGCPGVADPGAKMVELAHQRGIEVVPLVGPSSILLSLMASGMNGQKFCFQGYLSPKPHELAKNLKQLEKQSASQNQTQIFIETPYRNNNLIATALKTLSNNTQFCVAANLTLENEYVKTQMIGNWKKEALPDLHKQAAIFLLLAGR